VMNLKRPIYSAADELWAYNVMVLPPADRFELAHGSS
jgi:hypothetical protein